MSFDQNALDSLRIDRDQQTALHQPQRRMPRWVLITAAVLALLIIAYAVLRDGAVTVDTAVALDGSSTSTTVLNASGYVVAKRQATVSAKVTGKIAEVLIEEGMEVTADQLLARLDDLTARPQYALAQRQLEAAQRNVAEVSVRLAEAERNFNRLQALRQDKLVSEAQLDQAESDLAAYQARLATVRSEVAVAQGSLRVREQELDDLLVRAPFAGVVVSKDAQPGEMVSPISAGGGFTRTGIATLVDMSSLEIEVDVNEAFINRVQADQRTEAVLDAYPQWRIPSHVINIVPTADRQKATVRVRIGFDELDPRILPDMGVKVGFLDDAASGDAPRPGTVLIPTSAVFEEAGAEHVWRVRDDVAEKARISTAGRADQLVAVTEGLSIGDVVITSPGPNIKPGVKIQRSTP